MHTHPVIFHLTGATGRQAKGHKMKRSQIIGRWAALAGSAILITIIIAGI